jgi:DNA-binding transcriptional regulator YdaS (Cro superfamily)
MEAVLKTPNEVIDALGGTNKAAARLGKEPTAVSQWRKRNRIPPELFLSVSSVLQADGKSAAPEVFGMAVPDDGAEVAS